MMKREAKKERRKSNGTQILDHTADTGIRCWAPDPEGVFEKMALALTALMADPVDISIKKEKEISVAADDIQSLLVEWLNKILYLLEVEDFLFKDFKISEIDANKLKATGFGEMFSIDKHVIKQEIKACTYHLLEMKETPDGWFGQVILDI